MLWCALALLAHVLGGVRGLRLLRLDVPASVVAGEPAWLNCTLDLELDDLYSVKWYKDDLEFYRYLPSESPDGQKYDIPGVRLDLDRSTQSNVYLREADLHTEGMYRCEASAESPTFQTVEGQKPIKVFVLPQGGPTIEGGQIRYEAGDYVNITCQSAPSRPAADLQWFINGRKVRTGIEVSYPTVAHPSGLQSSLLGLEFEVQQTHLYHGLTLRCTATVSQTYSTASEELIVADRTSATSSPLTPLYVVAKDGPTISGRKPQYRAGEVLNVNCSSTKSDPAPELHWFINDEKVKDEYVIHYPATAAPPGGGAATLGLRLRLQSHQLRPEMRLKCTATLSRVINVRSDERRVDGSRRNSGLHAAENAGKVSERSSKSPAYIHHLSRIIFLVNLISCL